MGFKVLIDEQLNIGDHPNTFCQIYLKIQRRMSQGLFEYKK